MKIYKSCETLPIRRFFRIFDTDDLRNLIHGYDPENDIIELNSKQEAELTDIFETIYYEYSEISENHKLRSTLKKKLLIAEWVFTYTMISSLINIYSETGHIDSLLLMNELKDPNYNIEYGKPLKPQVKKLINKMKGLKNKIKVFKLKVAKSLEANKKEVKIDLDMDAIYLEKNLELKRNIDPDTTPVATWIKMIQISKIKAEQNVRS